MEVQLILSTVAIVLPWFSPRTLPFVLWSLLAVVLFGAGFFWCMDRAIGWDGLICLVFGVPAALLILASLSVCVFRVVHTNGGTRPAAPGFLFKAAAIAYGLAVLVTLGLLLSVQ